MTSEPRPMQRTLMLLPPSARLMPPSTRPMPPSGVDVMAARGPQRDPQVRASLDPDDDDATVNVRPAAGTVATAVPDIRRRVGEAFSAARTMAMDGEQRGNFTRRHGRTLLIAAAGLVLLGGGGWLYAGHQASVAAQQQVSDFLAATGMTGHVSYSGVSGSPFGAVSLEDVVIRDASNQPIATFGQLSVTGLRREGGVLLGVHLTGHAASLPLVGIAREIPNPFFANLISIGYSNLKGDVSFGIDADPAHESLVIDVAGDFSDMAALKLHVGFGGIPPQLTSMMPQLASASARNDPSALMSAGMMGLQFYQKVTLIEASFSADDADLMRRMADVPMAGHPDEVVNVPLFANPVSSRDLVSAGMPAAEAEAVHGVFDRWLLSGGKLRVETVLSQPLALFSKTGQWGGPSMAFSNLAAFLVASHAKVSG